MEFIETSFFTRSLLDILSDDEYRLLQSALILHPDFGPKIPGSGGLRKVRWSIGSHGKSGGARIIYFWSIARERIYMLLIYPKSEQDNLTSDQLKMLKRLIEREFR